MKMLAVILVCIALSACGGIGRSESDNDAIRGPYPTDWKIIAAAYIRNNYFDPHSVIDSEAAAPIKKRNTFLDPAWTLCIRNNAKNRLGGYTGRSITILNVRNGQVVGIDEYERQCQGVRFEPLPLR